MPKHERANFRAKYLKHVSLEILEEKALKRQMEREKLEKKEKVIAYKKKVEEEKFSRGKQTWK